MCRKPVELLISSKSPATEPQRRRMVRRRRTFRTILMLPERIATLIEPADVGWSGTPCWRWLGTHRSHDGRPVYQRRYVYRLTYELLIGPLPKGKGNAGHHGCERLWCINPWHLQPISQTRHMQLHGLGGDWGQALKTNCPAGHPYDEANTYWWRGERQCRTCQRQRSRDYYYKNLDANRKAARERAKRARQS